ncbi:MAG: DUF6150 family protein [Bacteroidota bacterium]
MKKLSFLFSITFIFLLCAGQNAQAQTSSRLCNLFGAVFVTPVPSQAQYKIFIEESEAFADLVVFKQSSALYADRSGQWYFTEFRPQATFSVTFTENKALADFSVYFTQTEAFAGCKQ